MGGRVPPAHPHRLTAAVPPGWSRDREEGEPLRAHPPLHQVGGDPPCLAPAATGRGVLTPSLLLRRRSVSVVEKYFEAYALVGQDILGSPESWEKVLALVPEDILPRAALPCRWALCRVQREGPHGGSRVSSVCDQP